MRNILTKLALILIILFLQIECSISYAQFYYLEVNQKNGTKKHLVTSIDSIIYENYNSQPYYMLIKEKNGFSYDYPISDIDSVTFIKDYIELYLDDSEVCDISFFSASFYGALKLEREIFEQSEFGLLISESITDLRTNGIKYATSWINWDYCYNFEVSGLEPDKTYYYCTYILYNGKYAYSDVNEFTTKTPLENIQTGLFDPYTSSVSSFINDYVLQNYIESCGICYGLNNEPSLESDQFVQTDIIQNNTFKVRLENIPYDTLVNYRAFIKIDSEVFYGATLQFYGNSIITGTINLTDFSIISQLRINEGYEELGICYGTDEKPLISDKTISTNVLNDNNEFIIELNDLFIETFDSIIYYRAYASTGNDIHYGQVRSFGGNSVTTGIIDTTSLQIESSVKYNYGISIYGVCYSNSDNPTINDMIVSVPETDQDNKYIVTLTDIPFGTVYYRAYVQRGSQTLYGDIRKFDGNKIYTGDFNDENYSISSSIKYSGNYPDAEFGVCYHFNPDIGKDYINYSRHLSTTLDNSTTAYELILDLIPFGTVNYCSYVTINGKTYYGDLKSFAGNSLTTGVYDQQSLEIKSHLKYELFGYHDVSYGVEYYFDGESYYDRKKVETTVLDSLNDFRVMLAKIPFGTTVNYMSFVKLDGYLRYGDALTFVKEMRVGEPIDLGLSVLWSSINMGADFPEEAGNYYAWGETEPKKIYRWYDYKWADTTSYCGSYTKYNIFDYYLYCNGRHIPDSIEQLRFDNKYRLDDEDDVAKVKWGGKWSLPTGAQIIELICNCSRQTVYINNMKCYKFISNKPGFTDRFIIIPAAGFYYSPNDYYTYYQNLTNYNSEGYYWSKFGSTSFSYYSDYKERYFGLNVRPVYGVSESWMDNHSIKFKNDTIKLIIGARIMPPVTLNTNGEQLSEIERKNINIYYTDNPFVVIRNDDMGGCLDAISEGVANITVEYGSATDSCVILVNNDIKPWLEQTKIVLNKDTVISTVGNHTHSSVSIYYDSVEVDVTSLYYHEPLPSGGEISVPYHKIEWYSDNPLIVTVDELGGVSSKAAGTAHLIITLDSITIASQTIVVLDEKEITPEYVDLGLSVNWATFNVGATYPTDFGGFYAWGETQHKEEFNLYNYVFRTEGDKIDNVKFSKYITDSKYGIIDNKTSLELIDDVAHVKWGDQWIIPSKAEFEELYANCTIIDSTVDGIHGLFYISKVKGFEGRSIFMPMPSSNYYNGYWFIYSYWTKDLHNSYSAYATNDPYYSHPTFRSAGCSIRPVTPSATWIDSISFELNYKEKQMLEKSFIQLHADVLKNGTSFYYPVTWESDNESIVSVDAYGIVYAKAKGTAVITAKMKSLSKQCIITVIEDTISQYEYVDLGLSVKWANVNIGALSPEDYGYYYSWGEIETKSYYNNDNYKFGEDYYTLSKYSYRTNYTASILDESDDVATQKLGNEWQIPSKKHFRELINNCSWEYKIVNGIGGCLVTSKIEGYTDRSIFIPLAGGSPNLNNEVFFESSERYAYTYSPYGFYWSCELYREIQYYDNYEACNLFIISDILDNHIEIRKQLDYLYRSEGIPIRPVHK